MTIIGVAGAIGSGKSFTQMKHGLKYVEERQKQLVTNFPIDVDALRQYASLPKQYQSVLGGFVFDLRRLIFIIYSYLHWALPFIFLKKAKKPRTTPQLPWIKRLCETGGIIQIPFPEKLEALLIPESVVLLDEAGILLNSREFEKTSKQLLADLAQSRKDGCDLIWCAQFDEQVDRQLRMLTQFWIHCESLSVFDKKMRRPKLLYKRIFWFRCNDYQEWKNNPRARGNHFKTRAVYSSLYEGGLLSVADKKIFEIFDSFKRLDKKYDGSDIQTIHQCKLPRDYYFDRLVCYVSQRDPLNKSYEPLWGYYSKDYVSTKKIVLEKKVTRSQLISKALNIATDHNLKAPYFKNMSLNDIKLFIARNS